MNSTHWLNKVMSDMYTNGSTTFFLGLSSTMPAANGTNVTEPTGGSYARIPVQQFTPPTNGVVKNTAELVFPRSTATWFPSTAKAAYWLLYDGAGSAAHLLSAGQLDEPKTIESNTVITVAAGTLSITLTDYMPSGV